MKVIVPIDNGSKDYYQFLFQTFSDDNSLENNIYSNQRSNNKINNTIIYIYIINFHKITR